MENDLLDYEDEKRPIVMAGFGLRFGASFLDGIILMLALVSIAFIVGSIIKLIKGSSEGNMIMGFGAVLFYFLFPFINILYHTFFEYSRYQATPGKMAFNIKVVNLRGEQISFMQSLGRNLGKIISGVIFYIGFLMAIWTDKKQGLHDMMADVYVIKKQEEALYV